MALATRSQILGLAVYQFRTNRGREAGVVLVHGEADWIPFSTPSGRTMIGLVTTFASGGGESKTGVTASHSRRRRTGACWANTYQTFKDLTGVTPIAMELRIDGEGAIPEEDDWYDDDEEYSEEYQESGTEGESNDPEERDSDGEAS